MHLTLYPQVPDGLGPRVETAISVSGDILTVNGVAYDLSAVPAGGEAIPEGDHPFIGPIRRSGGKIHATLRVALDRTAADDQPHSPWVIPNASGPVTIPAARKPAPEPEQETAE